MYVRVKRQSLVARLRLIIEKPEATFTTVACIFGLARPSTRLYLTRAAIKLMAILDILEFPDSRLRTIAKPVAVVDDEVRQLVDDMFETMYEAPGIGLAATSQRAQTYRRDGPLRRPQRTAGVHQPRVRNPDRRDGPVSGRLPLGARLLRKRRSPAKVKIKATDRDGQPYELIAEGLLAVCIQHECDHLNGKLFVDYLSTLKRDRIKKKLEKLHRQNA